MSDELPDNLRLVADFFGLIGTAPVRKDFYVVHAIRAIAAVHATPFSLVFAGGTALARAHKLVRRMSEDVDFKIVPATATPVSRSALRQQLGALRDKVTAALLAAGFAFDPKNQMDTRSRNESRYTVWNLPYVGESGAGEGLRTTLQIELTYAALRLPAVMLPVSSFVAEAYERPVEVAALPCVSLSETAAEKLIALTRRTAMEQAGLSRDPDPTLVRHIYDLHALRDCVDPSAIAHLARDIAAADAKEFGNQYPAYVTDMAAETTKALDFLRGDITRDRYDIFLAAMVYGEKPDFATALATVTDFTQRLLAAV